MKDLRISRPPFFRFNMEIYFEARSKISVKQFNRRSVSARSVLQCNQAASVCLWPSYRLITVSLFYRPYHRTVVWIMIKLVCLTARSSHVCRHPARPPDHLLVSYYLADAALSAFPSVVRSPKHSPGSCSACRRLPPIRRSPALSASPVDRSPVPGHFSDSRWDAGAIDCPLFPLSHVDVSGGHLSTCCLMKMAAASSLDRFCMKSVSSGPTITCDGRN